MYKLRSGKKTKKVSSIGEQSGESMESVMKILKSLCQMLLMTKTGHIDVDDNVRKQINPQITNAVNRTQ